MNIRFASFTIKWATSQWEVEQAYRIRRQVFCGEQQLFGHSDKDDTDRHALMIVAIGNWGGWHEKVVGTVRVHKEGDFWWVGSRLAVHPNFRRESRIGPSLIRMAVGSAKVIGCKKFTATVQAQNEQLFKRLNWHTLDNTIIHGKPHVTMQADIEKYASCFSPQTGFILGGSSNISDFNVWEELLKVSNS